MIAFSRDSSQRGRESPIRVYELRRRENRRGVDLISAALPFGRLWYGEPNAVGNPIGYAIHYSRSADAVIRVYDAGGNVIETHEHAGEFGHPRQCARRHLFPQFASRTFPGRGSKVRHGLILQR
jgi:hypothetical protein